MAPENSSCIHKTQLISIIVPTLDEKARISACLDAIMGQQVPSEVIVVDGGSSDSTIEIAESYGVRVIRSQPGRAKQMNKGAEASTGSILLFLHADTVLPHRSLERVRDAVERGLDGGAFTMRFDCSRVGFLVASVAADLYCRVTGDMFGDRAIFISRNSFERIGGYRELDLMEDLDIAIRLKRASFRTGLLSGPVISSARRFDRIGIWRGIMMAWKLTRAFHRGLPMEHLSKDFYSAKKR